MPFFGARREKCLLETVLIPRSNNKNNIENPRASRALRNTAFPANDFHHRQLGLLGLELFLLLHGMYEDSIVVRTGQL